MSEESLNTSEETERSFWGSVGYWSIVWLLTVPAFFVVMGFLIKWALTP